MVEGPTVPQGVALGSGMQRLRRKSRREQGGQGGFKEQPFCDSIREGLVAVPCFPGLTSGYAPRTPRGTRVVVAALIVLRACWSGAWGYRFAAGSYTAGLADPVSVAFGSTIFTPNCRAFFFNDRNCCARSCCS